jgi:hypothetical protein
VSNQDLIEVSRPAVCTGVTAGGWLTYVPGDVTISVHRKPDGVEYQVNGQGV